MARHYFGQILSKMNAFSYTLANIYKNCCLTHPVVSVPGSIVQRGLSCHPRQVQSSSVLDTFTFPFLSWKLFKINLQNHISGERELDSTILLIKL